jgi:hypothetical protein
MRVTFSRISRYLDVPTWESSLSTVCWSLAIYLRKWLVRSLCPFPPYLLDLSFYWQCTRLVHEPSKWVSQRYRLTVGVIPFAAAQTVRLRCVTVQILRVQGVHTTRTMWALDPKIPNQRDAKCAHHRTPATPKIPWLPRIVHSYGTRPE